MRKSLATLHLSNIVFVLVFLFLPSSAIGIEFSDVVATIEDKDLSFVQLLPKAELREEKRKSLSKRSYSQWALKYAASSLRAKLLKFYKDDLRKELALEPSSEQVETFVVTLVQSRNREKQELQRSKEQLEKRLGADRGLGAKERSKLQTKLEEIEGLISYHEEFDRFSAANSELQAKLDRQVATRYLSNWLIDRELYLKYDGRVAFRYGGPIPIDAYYQFLKEKRSLGEFRIHSKVIDQLFWGYFLREGRVLLVPDEDAKRIYSNATWSLERFSD